MKKIVSLFLLIISLSINAIAQQLPELLQPELQKAQQGDMKAQSFIGETYYWGYENIEKDYNKAFYWFRKAAEQGEPYAQYNLGCMYSKGQGVAQNDKEAMVWIEKAANQGIAAAQNLAGTYYEDGIGVSPNQEKAVYWYRKAAEQGNANSQWALGVCYMLGKGVQMDKYEANKWFRKSAEQGYYLGEYQLGVSYFYGEGVQQNYEEAAKWLTKVVEADVNEDISAFAYELCEVATLKADNPLLSSTSSYTDDNGYKASENSSYSSTNSYSTNNGYYASGYYDKSGRRSSWEFNCPKGYVRTFGLSVGYVSKEWTYQNEDYKESWSIFDNKWLNGLQIGLRYEPLFKYGFGLDVGLYYEYYYDRSEELIDTDEWGEYSYRISFSEHVLHIPIHAEYRLNFSESFQMFFYAGFDFDCGLYGKFAFTEVGADEPYGVMDEDIYSEDILLDRQRCNFSFAFGGGLRFKALQLNAGTGMGLVNMSDSPEYKVKQNNPLKISLAVMF